MPVTEGIHGPEFLLSEANGTQSREVVTIAAAAPAMVPGTLVGKITASGKYREYSNASSDGSEVAVGVLYSTVADKAVDQRAVIVARDAEVMRSALTGWDTMGGADLRELGIYAR